MVRTNQGGSILGFIVIGSVMALLLVGGVYFVRNYLSPETDRGPVAVENGSESQEDQEPAPEEEPAAPEEESEPDQEEGADQGGDTGTPAPEQPSDDEAQPQTEVPRGGASPENLPETGLADTLLTSLALSGVVAAAIAYKRSRDISVSL